MLNANGPLQLDAVSGELTPCLACGEPALASWRSATSSDGRSAATTYALVRCVHCGTAALAGRGTEDLEGLYTGGGYARPPRLVDRLIEPLRRVGDRAPLSEVAELGPGAKVLEIGSGDGRLLALLTSRGCDVAGVEPFATGQGPSVTRERIERIDLPPATYDAIVIWHALEHFDDPASVVEAAARALRPDGHLIVSVPVADSVQARIGGDRWFHQDVPRHRVLFTRAGLHRLLERSGLRVVSARSAVLDQNFLGMAQTLLNFVTVRRNVAFRALKGDTAGVRPYEVALSIVAAPLAVACALVLEPVAMAYGRGGSIVVRAALR